MMFWKKKCLDNLKKGIQHLFYTNFTNMSTTKGPIIYYYYFIELKT